ncbi:hypothetical protein NQ315_007571 [Exocentrus adspersus]|uniref:Uncharacterized protein n=1 Tax=Exocentrus adspersus TaxID=1586481 RepID=A0AAV8W9U3_9CUCU|nr:hypothetical protein NQ315_007571 [Exocentrus adspersus]
MVLLLLVGFLLGMPVEETPPQNVTITNNAVNNNSLCLYGFEKRRRPQWKDQKPYASVCCVHTTSRIIYLFILDLFLKQ